MQDRFRKKLWHTNRKEFIKEFSILQTVNSEGNFEHTYFERNPKLLKLERLSTCQIKEIQCTGLKDKNGKLIYEGDIVKYAEFDWTDFSFKDWETEIAQVVWGNTYDNYYPAFDLKDTDFDGTNAFAYLFNEGWTIEVIGNRYENPELLED